ncbi:alpha/beta hydrolase [Halobacillus sp. A5]|uniref:alpha/beta hydrolase n=1 Tax=Halobacillus sp. A5 TaxID=2880263 RepID=UPI0020A65D32|nr:alpha/beta hydrolase [Halobacillus sp. A5]MCP3028312.1 alpha/beta hydrolase [Halobacillus sp. A5]
MTPDKLATIIIVHGAFEHSGRYNHLVEQLQKDNFEAVIHDLPGQGRTEGLKGHIRSFSDYINKIKEWVEEADDNLPVFLLGHSMGGVIVVRALQTYNLKVNGVILSSPAFAIKNGAGKPMEAASRLLNYIWPTFRVTRALKPESITKNPEIIARHKKDNLIIDKVSVRWYNEFQRSINRTFKEIDKFPNLPLLVMQSGDDLIVDPLKTYQWFQEADSSEKSYKEWPGFYHEIFNEVEWQLPYKYLHNFLHQQLPGHYI